IAASRTYPQAFYSLLLILIYSAFFCFFFFFFTDTATTEIYTLSLHDALPISWSRAPSRCFSSTTSPAANSTRTPRRRSSPAWPRSEEHTSELQSRRDLVCRLLLEKKKKHRK